MCNPPKTREPFEQRQRFVRLDGRWISSLLGYRRANRFNAREAGPVTIKSRAKTNVR